MKYVFNVRPRLLYVIFRFCKFSVPVLRFGVTDNPIQGRRSGFKSGGGGTGDQFI